MGIQPSASKTDLLLQCPRPFEAATEISIDEASAAARWGSAAHAVLYGFALAKIDKDNPNASIRVRPPPWVEPTAALKKYNLPSDRAAAVELLEHCKNTWTTVCDWMNGENPWRQKFRVKAAEQSLALYVPRAGKPTEVLPVDLDEENHVYNWPVGDQRFMIGMTIDIELTSCTDDFRRVILDYKTGITSAIEFQTPAELPQMRTLALATHANAVGIVHCPLSQTPKIYVEEIDAAAHESRRKALRRALLAVDNPPGAMRVGPACKWCPARDNCPTQTADLLAKAASLAKRIAGAPIEPLTSEVDRGVFIELSRKLEKLFKIGRDEIAEEIRNGAIYENREGKPYKLATRQRRNLSLKSIVEAYGRVEGEAKIAELEKDGAVTTSEWEELTAR